MKKITQYIIISFLIFSLTSCLEINETIKVNKDKSGSIKYELTAGEAGGLLGFITSFLDVSIEDQVTREAEKLIVELKKQPGISNIKHNFNRRSGSYSLSFDFKNSKYFNEALYGMAGSKKNIFTPGYVNISNSRFKKINFSPWIKRYLEREKIEIPYNLLTEEITFNSNVELPNTIKSVKPKNTVIQKGSNTTKQSFELTEITSGNANTRLKVTFKK